MSEQLKKLFSASLEAHGGLQDVSVSHEEIAGAYDEVETSEADVITTENVYRSLSEVSAALEASVAAGTCNDATYQMAKLSVETTTSFMGVGLECVANFSEVGEAQVTVESLGETLKKIWETIKTVVQRAIKATVDFFTKLFGGIGRLRGHLTRLESKVKALPSDPKGKLTLRSAANLSYRGRMGIADIQKGLDATAVAGALIVGDYTDKVQNYYETAARLYIDPKFIGATGQDSAHVNTTINFISANDKSFLGVRVKLKGIAVSGSYVIEDAKIAGNAVTNFTRLESAKPNEAVELDAPKKDELLKMIARSLDIVTQLEKRKGAIEKVARVREGVLKSVDEFIKKGDRGLLGEYWTQSKAQSLLRQANVNWVRPINQYTNIAYSTVRAVSDLVEQAIKTVPESE